MLEENFITSMIKADGNMLAFFSRPIAATLAVVTILVWLMPVVMKLLKKKIVRPMPPEVGLTE
jgi:TctA family transporter